jgi:tetratricopeptide (TPR) repeat protein
LSFPLVSAPAAENQFALSVTLPQIEKDILKYHRLLALSPRSDPHRPTLLMRLAVRRNSRYPFSLQKDDFDKSIAHLTEAVLLPFQPSEDVVLFLFQLASVLLSRFNAHKQPEYVKSSLKYFRFLRINFHPLESFGIPHGDFTSRLVRALAQNLVLGSGDMMQEMQEMVALIPEFLASDVSTDEAMPAIEAFADAVTKTELFCRRDTQQVADRVIQMVRDATVLKPDLHVSFALASCLAVRFKTTQVINDYEEAIAIGDKIVAAPSPGETLTPMQTDTIKLIFILLVSRLNLYPRPEYLEDAIHRIRTFLCLPSLPDQFRKQFTVVLDSYAGRRSSYFGVAGDSGETPPTPSEISNPVFALLVPEDDPAFEMEDKMHRLEEILAKIRNDETTDVEAAVELGRTFLPLQQSCHQWSFLPTVAFAHILFEAYQRTNRLDYLNEAITLYRDLRKGSVPKSIRFHAGYKLLKSVIARSNLFHLRPDIEEAVQLLPELANDGTAEVFTRFNISCGWAYYARISGQPSASVAYETAMSLMQETLVFSPTLQTQHFRLAHVIREGGALPSDYASYQIETGQFKQAIETLERGRALLWSEMRGLRTSTEQLRAADPAITDKLADINRRLESVTMSVAQSESGEIGDIGTGAGRREGMDSIGHLVTTQRKLLEERDTLISHIQSLPGFQNFLKPPSFDVLNAAAVHGPVIIINQSRFSSHIILLLEDSPPSVISTPSNLHDRANRLKDELLRVRKDKGLDSEDYDLTLASVLADLYELVGKFVIERLRQMKVPEKSRVWWCPTGAFCSLPLHAMGPVPSDDGKVLYFLDLYITSYTPTLSALIESRKLRSLPETFDKPSLLLVAQPETLFGAWDEIRDIQTTETPITTLVSAMATPKTVVERLRDHQFAHFVCHGLLEIGKPFDASLELHGDSLTLLEIVRSQLPAAEFAFLSACHTAELTEDSVADEGLHLAAAMQYCGFRSVVGTMWAMADTDGADLSKHFYQSIFLGSTGRKRVPYYERSARALQLAVKKLRRKRGITLERWVNFVHYGA